MRTRMCTAAELLALTTLAAAAVGIAGQRRSSVVDDGSRVDIETGLDTPASIGQFIAQAHRTTRRCSPW